MCAGNAKQRKQMGLGRVYTELSVTQIKQQRAASVTVVSAGVPERFCNNLEKAYAIFLDSRFKLG